MNIPNRDDFTAATRRSLAERVGSLCSNPDCRASTSGPQIANSKSMNVGVAAHITAAAQSGPRYDPSLSADERADITNGIWLCQNCAKLVDNDLIRYSADVLRQWKFNAEQEALNRLGKTAPNSEKEIEIIDKWVSTAHVEKAGILKNLQEEGYELRWTTAKMESERVDLEGWKPVLLGQPNENQARLKIKDQSVIGGYLILLKKRKQFFSRKTGLDLSSKDFTVQPINILGENILKEDKSKNDEFFVNTHFNFTTAHAIEIINIDLRYDLERASPMSQTINFDTKQEEPIDASYRMINRRKIEKHGVVNIFVSRRFRCDPVFIIDYQRVDIYMELVSPDWKGVKFLHISGKLQPGGKIANITLSLLDR